MTFWNGAFVVVVSDDFTGSFATWGASLSESSESEYAMRFMVYGLLWPKGGVESVEGVEMAVKVGA